MSEAEMARSGRGREAVGEKTRRSWRSREGDGRGEAGYGLAGVDVVGVSTRRSHRLLEIVAEEEEEGMGEGGEEVRGGGEGRGEALDGLAAGGRAAKSSGRVYERRRKNTLTRSRWSRRLLGVQAEEDVVVEELVAQAEEVDEEVELGRPAEEGRAKAEEAQGLAQEGHDFGGGGASESDIGLDVDFVSSSNEDSDSLLREEDNDIEDKEVRQPTYNRNANVSAFDSSRCMRYSFTVDSNYEESDHL